MSPEQINQSKYNEKCDIWSLGCLLCEMATLYPPFQAKNQIQLSHKIKSGKIENLPKSENQSKELIRVVEWCLYLDPNKRPSASQLIGIPRVSNILKAIKLKNLSLQVDKIKEKNILIENEIKTNNNKLKSLESELDKNNK